MPDWHNWSQGGLEPLQLFQQIFYVRLQLCHSSISRQVAAGSAPDQIVQRNAKQIGKLNEEIHRTSSFARFDTPIIALVNIQHLCEFLLCVAILDTELADTRAALFYVISHGMASNLEFRGYVVRDWGHGYFAM